MKLNLRKNKWLHFGSFHPPSQSDEYFFNNVKYSLDIYSKCFDKYMLVGDFKAEESEQCLSEFLFEMNAKNIVKAPTCFKSLCNPSCIDLVITNSSSNFQNTKAISTGLSDFHKMIVTLSFLLAFEQILDTCLSNFRLLSGYCLQSIITVFKGRYSISYFESVIWN